MTAAARVKVIAIVIAASCLALGRPSWSQTVEPETVKTSVTDKGLVADLYTPADARGRLPAVIVLGGSEGGLGEGAAREARLIAERGYVVLQLAYFGAPGLPQTLQLVPLEYFKTAIDWLRSQPGVDPGRIGVEGTSIGGETALVVAARYPQITVVVAGAPSSVVWPGISRTDPNPPSTYTLAGRPLPYLPYGWTGSFVSIFALYNDGLKAVDRHPDAVIAAEQINGPVMLICGNADTLWPSCSMSEQVAARLKSKGFRRPVQLLEYPDAGHAAFGPPADPASPHFANLGSLGGTPGGNNAARRDDWARSLAFLDAALKP